MKQIENGKHVSDFEINKVQKRLHLILPISLQRFYRVHGAGRIISDNDTSALNKVLSPFEIMDVIKHQNRYRFTHSKAPYEDMRSRQIPFLETDPNHFLTIGYGHLNMGNIYEDNQLVARSLDDYIAGIKPVVAS